MSDVVSSDEFRRLCGHFATGVTVITTRDAAGAPTGMTATSFTSVSLEPPLISVAIGHDATIYPAILQAPRFVVNILEAHQEALSRRFADSRDDRFDGVPWEESADGQVVLTGTLAHLCCEKIAEVEAGDHTLFLGRVVGGGVADHGHALLHYRGGYADVGGS